MEYAHNVICVSVDTGMKMLSVFVFSRAETADDIMLSSSEIKRLALGIEKELYYYFKDTDSKYKAKYRSLVFNIKDVKNKVSRVFVCLC